MSEKTVTLPSGGTVTLKVEADIVVLSADERTFIYTLIDTMDEFRRENPPPAEKRSAPAPRKRTEKGPRMKATEAEAKVLDVLPRVDFEAQTAREIGRAAGVPYTTAATILQRLDGVQRTDDKRYWRPAEVDSEGGGGGREVEAGSVG